MTHASSTRIGVASVVQSFCFLRMNALDWSLCRHVHGVMQLIGAMRSMR